MAFLKTADALVQTPSLNVRQWEDKRSALVSSKSFHSKAASKSLKEYNPDQYLLSHVTIMASVDVEDAPNVKTGSSVQEGNKSVKRLWSDYHITAETSKYINANADCWDRQTLLNTYSTFIGAQNYVEHVQIEELSKGRIIDAVARDLGDTIYIDILVATDRKHKTLIADIESGRMNSMSMGCSIQYSRCSKCGNVAADDTEMCDHIRYEKGNTFIDAQGISRVIAELCGHSSDNDSVVYIEASWVANPAFKGAVTKMLLNPAELSQTTLSSTQDGFQFHASPMLAQFMEAGNMEDFIREASYRPEALESMRDNLRLLYASNTKTAFNFDDDAEEGEEEGKKKEKNMVEEIKNDLSEEIKKDIKKKLRREIKEELDLSQKEPTFEGVPEGESVNDNVINAYQTFERKYSHEITSMENLRKTFLVLRTASSKGWNSLKDLKEFSNRDIVAGLHIAHRDHGKSRLPGHISSCLLKVGGCKNYANVGTFLNACKIASGKNLTKQEAMVLIKLGHYLN